jgi:Cu/Ag efflux protein CusF
MFRTPHSCQSLFAAAAVAVAAVLLLLSAGVGPALAQASGYSAEIAKIDMSEKRVTLKASMGQQTMRVASGVALDMFKPGDKVLVTFGQEGTESVITKIVVAKP